MNTKNSAGVNGAFTIDEACHHLSVSRATLYRLARSGRLRTVKLGARVLIPFDAIDELLAGSDA